MSKMSDDYIDPIGSEVIIVPKIMKKELSI